MLAPMEVVVNSKESMKSSLENVDGAASVTGPERSKGYQKYTLILKDNPYSNEAMDVVPKVRAAADKGNDVYIAGQTATQYDDRAVTEHDEKSDYSTCYRFNRDFASMLLALDYSNALLSRYSSLVLRWSARPRLGHHSLCDGCGGDFWFDSALCLCFHCCTGEDYNIFMISSIWKTARRCHFEKRLQKELDKLVGLSHLQV